jgi:hypothetical protein
VDFRWYDLLLFYALTCYWCSYRSCCDRHGCIVSLVGFLLFLFGLLLFTAGTIAIGEYIVKPQWPSFKIQRFFDSF